MGRRARRFVPTRWLSRRGIRSAVSDAAAFEQMPSPSMQVHVHLLVECGGSPIMECRQHADLLAADRETGPGEERDGAIHKPSHAIRQFEVLSGREEARLRSA